MLFWDGSGLWVCSKRLEKGRFRWPEAASGETRVTLGHEQLALLVGGIDLAAARPRRWYRKVTVTEENGCKSLVS
jgi:transposase